MEREDPHYVKMTTAPVGGLIASLAVPTVVSMLVSALYNTADTYFVSRLGTSASGAVGVVFSLMAVIQAVGFTIGMGSGSWISRLLGAHEAAKAGEVASTGFFSSLLFGALLAIVGIAFVDPFVRLLGATDTIAPYARDYAVYILAAAPVMTASFVLNNVLRSEGKARYAMIGIAFGGILNCALDPLFIFGFGMGIAGAAIATALSQMVSLALLLVPFLRGRTVAKLSPARIAGKAGTYLVILENGLPSLLRQGLASVATIGLNLGAARFGDSALAAMAIVGKLTMVVMSIVIGIGQGYMPVVGYGFGAGKFSRVRRAFSLTLRAMIGVMAVLGAAGFLAAPGLLALFLREDPQVVTIGAAALRAQCLVMPFMALGIMCNMTFQAVGKSWTSTLLSSLRQGLFFLPLIFILPAAIGLLGVQATQPLADLLTFLFDLPFILAFLRDLNARARAET